MKVQSGMGSTEARTVWPGKVYKRQKVLFCRVDPSREISHVENMILCLSVSFCIAPKPSSPRQARPLASESGQGLLSVQAVSPDHPLQALLP